MWILKIYATPPSKMIEPMRVARKVKRQVSQIYIRKKVIYKYYYYIPFKLRLILRDLYYNMLNKTKKNIMSAITFHW